MYFILVTSFSRRPGVVITGAAAFISWDFALLTIVILHYKI